MKTTTKANKRGDGWRQCLRRCEQCTIIEAERPEGFECEIRVYPGTFVPLDMALHTWAPAIARRAAEAP
jgi:hypothetical protein